MLQNATPLRKSVPWPPNISNEHVIVLRLPRDMHLCGSSSNAPRLPPFLEMQNLHVLLTFDKVPNPLRVLRARQFFTFLTSKCTTACAFSTSTSESGPSMVCFVHFDLEICFAPQLHALYRHLNFQKCSDAEVLCTFWLGNLLRATTACTFSTSQLPKVVRRWGVLYILTWKCASRHNGVQFFISHLASWLRTRRFSEPTFRPSGATNHWKNTVFRCVSRLFYLFTHLHLLSSDSFSSLIFSLLLVSLTLLTSAFPSVHIVGSLTSKLPSIIVYIHICDWMDIEVSYNGVPPVLIHFYFRSVHEINHPAMVPTFMECSGKSADKMEKLGKCHHLPESPQGRIHKKWPTLIVLCVCTCTYYILYEC